MNGNRHLHYVLSLVMNQFFIVIIIIVISFWEKYIPGVAFSFIYIVLWKLYLFAMQLIVSFIYYFIIGLMNSCQLKWLTILLMSITLILILE